MTLSKSQYIRGLQCVKSLWLKKYRSELLSKPDSSSEATLDTGHKVGELACKLFSDGVVIPEEVTSLDKKVLLTQ